jgi:hypothetical protein
LHDNSWYPQGNGLPTSGGPSGCRFSDISELHLFEPGLRGGTGVLNS